MDKSVWVYVDVFRPFQRPSCTVAQSLSQMGPNFYHRESRSRMNGVTIKVNWEVHSSPFKGFSQPPQSFEYEDE